MNNYDQWKLATPWENEQDTDLPFEASEKRDRLDKILECLYDYEHIDIEKFYNDKYNYQLLMEFDNGNDKVIEQLEKDLQSFLDFETNYNIKLGDF